MTRVAILGFGLIGGSLALALRRAGVASHVAAIDLPEVIRSAHARDAADTWVDANDEIGAARALDAAGIAVLAAPVTVIAERVLFALEHAPVVTDCGSTKRRLLERARLSPRARRFVPGHPMAGLPEGGIERARADLFRERPWILCADEADADAVAEVEAMVLATGARAVRMSAGAHDSAVARTSHLPQLLASALAVMAGERASQEAAGPAFERATQAAGGPAAIWRDIFGTNGDEVAAALAELIAVLEPIGAELRDGRTDLAARLLERARAARGSRPN